MILSRIPFEPVVFGLSPNVHLILEYLAFFIAFRYYLYLRKRTADPISGNNRLSIMLGAIFGALFFSRFMAFLENPILHAQQDWVFFLNNKTIMGGLFGGLLGVELAKKIIGEKESSGDLFALPVILGIGIGRLGCFLSGTKEFTYGTVTASPFGMDLGDGLLRHPIALYEMVFLILVFVAIQQINTAKPSYESGDLFKGFMVLYFGFRFLIEFIKPNGFLIFGLSSIQYLCVLCWLYYWKFIRRKAIYARKKVHLL